MVSILCFYFAWAASGLADAADINSEESHMDPYFYVFEVLLTLAVTSLVSTVWLLFSHRAWKRVTETGVQCDLLLSHVRPPQEHVQTKGAIYFAPSSVRWHTDRHCRHLKHSSGKISDLTPCKTCCFGGQ